MLLIVGLAIGGILGHLLGDKIVSKLKSLVGKS